MRVRYVYPPVHADCARLRSPGSIAYSDPPGHDVWPLVWPTVYGQSRWPSMLATVVVALIHEPSERCSSCVKAPFPYGAIPSCFILSDTMFAIAPCSCPVGAVVL